MRSLAAGFIAVVIAGAMWRGVPRLLDVLRTARSLAPLSMQQRRETLFGPWYSDAERLQATIPRNAVVDIVMVTPNARDVAVLAGATLQPRVCQYFDGWDSWRRRERAIFLHDRRAANAAPGAPVRPANVVIAVNPDATPALRRW